MPSRHRRTWRRELNLTGAPCESVLPRLILGRSRTLIPRTPMTAPLRSRYAPISILVVAAAAGCSGASVSEKENANLFTQHVEFGEEVRLEENAAVINVSPRVSPDRYGFLIADPREAQIRIYSRTGELKGHFGRLGRGPGEFDRVVAAARLPGDEILAADMDGRISIFDSNGEKLLHHVQTPLAPVYNVAVIDTHRIAITGRIQGRLDSPLVHVWNMESKRIERSFFRPHLPNSEFTRTYAFTGFTDVAIRGDTAAVLFSLSDSLYVYTLDGIRRTTIPLPFLYFRQIRRPMPKGLKPEMFRNWLRSFSAASRVFWLPDNRGYFIQYFDLDEFEPQWGLLHISSTGERLFDVTTAPKLLAVSNTAESSLFFVKPGSETENTLSIARIRQ